MQTVPDILANDPILLQQMLREVYAENDKLRLLIQRFTRHEFGRRSEQLTPDQLQFGLEDQEQTVAEHQAAQDAAEAAGGGQPKPRTTPRPTRNHGALPAHLPRYEVVIDVAHEACPCCGDGAFTSPMRVSRWAAAARFTIPRRCNGGCAISTRRRNTPLHSNDTTQAWASCYCAIN